jgi:hypothetical protein
MVLTTNTNMCLTVSWFNKRQPQIWEKCRNKQNNENEKLWIKVLPDEIIATKEDKRCEVYYTYDKKTIKYFTDNTPDGDYLIQCSNGVVQLKRCSEINFKYETGK